MNERYAQLVAEAKGDMDPRAKVPQDLSWCGANYTDFGLLRWQNMTPNSHSAMSTGSLMGDFFRHFGHFRAHKPSMQRIS